MNIELLFDSRFRDPRQKIVGETIASQLPGRQNGGAADAYRHILLAAELTRDYGIHTAYQVLVDHEVDSRNGADNGLDMWNNAIGVKIGEYVRRTGGNWTDVVRLSRAVISLSFDGPGYDQVGNWKVRQADDGLRRGFELYTELWGDPAVTYEMFADNFNRSYAFRANDKSIVLEDGNLELFAAAMTSPSNWIKNPLVEIDGKEVELGVDASAFPTLEWFTGEGFVYEQGNAAPRLSFDEELLPRLHGNVEPGSRSDLFIPAPGQPSKQVAAATIFRKNESENKDPSDRARDDRSYGSLGTPQADARPLTLNTARRIALSAMEYKTADNDSPQLALKPGVRRLLSGDPSAFASTTRRPSPNLLRLLMGGHVPRVKGATRLEDIARLSHQ